LSENFQDAEDHQCPLFLSPGTGYVKSF